MAKKPTTRTSAGRTRKGAKTRMTSTGAPSSTRTRDPRLPAPGTVITRRYKGRELRLTVLDEGFRFEGETYRSLTATALKATGYPAISGPHFWKLTAPAAPTPKRGTRKGTKRAPTSDVATQPATAATTA
jgi:hypothetical protein